MRGTDEWKRHVARAGLIVENLGIVNANIGQGLADQMGRFQAQIGELG